MMSEGIGKDIHARQAIDGPPPKPPTKGLNMSQVLFNTLAANFGMLTPQLPVFFQVTRQTGEISFEHWYLEIHTLTETYSDVCILEVFMTLLGICIQRLVSP